MSIITPLGLQSTTLNATGTKLGVVDGSNAATGAIGEFLENLASTPFSISSATYTDVAFLTLNPGDYDLDGTIVWDGIPIASATPQYLSFYGTVHGNDPTGLDDYRGSWQSGILPSTASTDAIITLPTYRVSISTQTTYYLKVYAIFASGTLNVSGYLRARRACVTQ